MLFRSGRGYARDLIDQAFFELHLRGIPLCILIPQEKRLFDFYAPFGFRPAGRARGCIHAPAAGDAELQDITQLNMIYEAHFAGVPHVLRTPFDWEMILWEADLIGARVFPVAGGGYVMQQDGRVMEAAGPGVVDSPGEAAGCIRIIENEVLRAHARAYAPALMLPEPARDVFCPWNRHTGARGAVALEDVLFNGLYMNLMHN